MQADLNLLRARMSNGAFSHDENRTEHNFIENKLRPYAGGVRAVRLIKCYCLLPSVSNRSYGTFTRIVI